MPTCCAVSLGALGVVYFKRSNADSVVGRTYDTLMPRYWQTTTFLWDYALSSTVHALLDPQVMRTHLERVEAHDIHACYGPSGSPVSRSACGTVNDHAMAR